MSYAMSGALQAAVYGALRGDVVLAGLVGDAIFDAEPMGVLPATYVSLGSETVRARADGTAGGALHELVVSVVTETPGFASAKTAALAICDALVEADLDLSRGYLVSLRFYKARSLRVEKGTRRRIDLTFRARVDEG